MWATTKIAREKGEREREKNPKLVQKTYIKLRWILISFSSTVWLSNLFAMDLILRMMAVVTNTHLIFATLFNILMKIEIIAISHCLGHTGSKKAHKAQKDLSLRYTRQYYYFFDLSVVSVLKLIPLSVILFYFSPLFNDGNIKRILFFWYGLVQFGLLGVGLLLLVDSMRFNCCMRLSCITQTNISRRVLERADVRANVFFRMSSNSPPFHFSPLLLCLLLFSSRFCLVSPLRHLGFAFVVVVGIVVVVVVATNHVSVGKCDLMFASHFF